MLIPRILPCLLIDSSQHLVKTISFDIRTYIGDPLNAAYLFSSFEADEILVLDIDASTERRSIRLDFVKELARFASVPLTIGGGITSLQIIEDIISLGVERVALSSALASHPALLNDAISHFGSSSIVVIINVVTSSDGIYFARFGKELSSPLIPLDEAINFCQTNGAGEIVLHDVNRDGTRLGFNNYLFSEYAKNCDIPVIALGGGSTQLDVQELFNSSNIAAAALGSSFVYAPNTSQVLINYYQSSNVSQSFE